MRGKTVGILFAVAVGVVIMAGDAYSQSYLSFKAEREDILKKASRRIGPFRIYPVIQFRDIGYDDNVYYQREEDEPVSDYTGTFSPEVKVYLLFRNYLILSFTENPEYVYYAEQKRERRWNNTVSPELKILLMHRFVLGGKYSYSNRRYRATSEFDIRANELREGYRMGLSYETARGTSFGFGASSEKISYEDIMVPGEEIYLSRALDRREEKGDINLYYRVFSESFFFLKGDYTDYNFRHFQSKWRDSYSWKASTGIMFPMIGRVIGMFSLGYKELVPRIEGKKGFSGFVGDTSIQFRVWRMWLRAKFLRDCQFSYWTNNVFFIEDRAEGGISFYLTKYLRLDYAFNYGEARYPELIPQLMPGGGYVDIKRKDIYRAHTAGFAVRIIRNTGIGIRVTWWERDSNFVWVNRDRMFVGGYVTYEF